MAYQGICRRLLCGQAALLMLILLSAQATAQRRPNYRAAREKMVENFIRTAGVKDPRVLKSLRETPRHEFVPKKVRDRAYFDMALPIGDKQTISSPFIVAYMTESLRPLPTDKVLEIGTGSGFQAAVLSPLVKDVYTIEIVPSLGRRAQRTLKRLRYRNVHVKIGDGFQGWPEHAPFDKIIVTCSPEKVPIPLVTQLREGGLMVIPVGERYQQTLYLLRKVKGKLKAEALRPTLFVPMTGRAEDNREVKPDPLRPRIVNGDFEQPPKNKDGFLPGWYYQRQLTRITDDEAPRGKAYIKLENTVDGRIAHVIQGLPIDGERIARIELSARVRHENVIDATGGGFSTLAITFYDPDRKVLGNHIVQPFRGDAPWTRVRRIIRVPRRAREAIVRVGLFGATGSLSVDDVQLRVVP